MPMTLHNIAGFPPPTPGTSHATAVTAGRIVHISGQPGTDETGALVPGGLAAQTERALRNVALALEAAGARPEHAVKSTFYVAGWEPSMVEPLMEGGAAARADIPFPDVAVTLIGVQSLFTPEMLIEIETVAVIP
jgi:enamine deaminase RidA (YjgF/YER057c/UK114 family)